MSELVYEVVWDGTKARGPYLSAVNSPASPLEEVAASGDSARSTDDDDEEPRQKPQRRTPIAGAALCQKVLGIVERLEEAAVVDIALAIGGTTSVQSVRNALNELRSANKVRILRQEPTPRPGHQGTHQLRYVYGVVRS